MLCEAGDGERGGGGEGSEGWGEVLRRSVSGRARRRRGCSLGCKLAE